MTFKELLRREALAASEEHARGTRVPLTTAPVKSSRPVTAPAAAGRTARRQP
jgi:hypothetical protein